MLLRDIRNEIQARGQVAICDLARQFMVDEGVLDDLLEVLVRRGQVKRVRQTCPEACESCPAARRKAHMAVWCG